jgi:hypothetical protein
MSATPIEQLADAVLYEGYNLYPYRPSALKNRHRWLFGCVLPRAWCDVHQNGERWAIQTQCLLLAKAGSDGPSGPRRARRRPIAKQGPVGPTRTYLPESSRIEIQVGFLRPVRRDVQRNDGEFECWQEPEECRVAGTFDIADLLQWPGRLEIDSAESCNGAAISARALVECERCTESDHLFRLTVRIENLTELPDAATASRDDALLQSLVSTHVILRTVDGEFVSLIDPPAWLRDAADACENIGLWPVLAGDEDRRRTMLAAPIILPDFPQIAPESPGDLFDGTEIDELLSLRIQTLTDAEKREAAAADERTRELLDRTEALDAAALRSLHGTSRVVPGFRPGDRVRLRPNRRADAFDLLLYGKAATVAAVERDFEDCVHLAVTIDDDPGQDLGARGMPGHRFFFRPEEVERVEEAQR